MSQLAERLKGSQPVVTAELNPPKGVDLSGVLASAERLRSFVSAFNVTDSPSSVMSQGSLALARMLVERGLEPVLQVTCRDRNRIALQSDILAAAALGVRNLLCLTGDDPRTGDHPEAKPVFDLDVVTLTKAADSLRRGADLAGNRLKDAPDLFIGAVVNPGAPDLDKELARMHQKIEAGCAFFQAQAVFDLTVLDRFAPHVQGLGVPILIGIIILKSARMAQRMNQSLPGINIPEVLVRELESAVDPGAKGVEIAGRLAKGAVARFRGLHVMALGWEHRIPEVLERAGVVNPARDVS